MSKQPTALYLADVLSNDPRSKAHHDAAAFELRRLHAQRDALLEALQSIVCHEQGVQQYRLEKGRAAIKQAEDFSPEAIRATQAAWKMGYDARKAEENT